MFSWPLRIAGWIIGIYAMLKLAAATGTVTYTKVFQAWLDQLRDILDLGFILKPLTQAVILPALDLIRSFDIPIPALQDHWQQVFVLTWLLTAAVARNRASPFHEGSYVGASVPKSLGYALVFIFPFCVAAGVVSIYSLAAAIWPAAGFLLFLGWREEGKFRAGLLMVSAGSIAIGNFLPVFAFEAPALLPLAGFVFIFGLSVLLTDLISQLLSGSEPSLQYPGAATGLDITAAMLGAFGLATAFADPPLF